MGTRSFERLEELYLAASELGGDELERFLAEQCREDGELRAEVEKLLAVECEAAEAFGPEGREAALIPEQVDGFRVLGVIGRGGMGTVYKAEQENPRRAVALKVLRQDCFSASARRRFEHEVATLGRLKHPGIAQIYDAGTFDSPFGPQPFFAMELVDGRTLLRYADEERLVTRQRLLLFTKICDAVEHAHRRGVIHRDLKPGNVLVGPRGQPKVLDFGIARATDSDLEVTTIQTDVNQLIGTLAYMSPEQTEGDSFALDTRSDVYSLGVILYQLLCGQLPYRVDHKVLPEALRVIREEEPTPLSSFQRVLRGDVETIAAKALAKDVERRYPSAAELAADIHRHLDNEPILARPPSALYQLRKFTARNRVLVGGVLATVLALAIGMAAFAWQASQAREAARIAEEEKRQAISHSGAARLAFLLQQARDELWPRRPHVLDRMRGWIDNAWALTREREVFEAARESLRSRAASTDGGEPEFGDYGDRLFYADLGALLEGLDSLVEPDSGGIARMEERVRATEEIERVSLVTHAGAWEDAATAIAESERYGGLELEPVFGLVPIGADLDSKLWEFWFVESGDRPQRGADGRLVLTDATGLVFVLIPGGTYTHGAQSQDPGGVNYNGWVQSGVERIHDVELGPFFLSKYEITQGQWMRFTGDNPSYYPVGYPYQHTEGRVSLQNPVELVSYEDCERVLGQLGLVLPTEAQWEAGCRGDGDQGWWGALGAAAFDAIAIDGTAGVHLPVGTREPNSFGLHDTFGNVSEWCRDRWDPSLYSEANPPRPGDGLRAASSHPDIATRGSAITFGNTYVRPTCRRALAPRDMGSNVGVRPALPVLP